MHSQLPTNLQIQRTIQNIQHLQMQSDMLMHQSAPVQQNIPMQHMQQNMPMPQNMSRHQNIPMHQNMPIHQNMHMQQSMPVEQNMHFHQHQNMRIPPNIPYQQSLPAQTNYSNNVMQQTPNQIQPFRSLNLDSAQAIKLSMGTSMFEERKLMARNDIWHKIKVNKGGTLDKEYVLKSILLAIAPEDLIPVKYQIVGDDSFFIARNCNRALEKLCQTSLIVKCLDGTPLILSITLGFASIHDLKINIQPLLLSVLKKKHNPEKKLLNLDSFHKDPEIYKTVYCPLTQNRTFSHVLKLIKTAFAPIEYLSLQKNDLKQLTMLVNINIKSITILDLRDNELLRIQTLEPLKNFNIKELWLDGNPLCENYSNPIQYVESVRKYCPQICKLDGIQVNSPGFPLSFKSYITNCKKKFLIKQFVEHFFSAYDFQDRGVLRGLYDKDSWYSTTVSTPTNPKSKKLLQPFGLENRNLMIFGKNSQQKLYHGEEEILKIFKKLPESIHIRNSFSCDLIFDHENILTISVEGLFKLRDVKDEVFFFNRTFILKGEEDDEYKIVNDQYHIHLPTKLENTIHMNLEYDELPSFKPIIFSQNDKENLIVRLQEVTTMTTEYCEKYLIECSWDIKKAITVFMNKYKNGKIPKEALNF